jgi:hypothetical protein
MWNTLALAPTRLAVAPQAARATSQFAAGQPVATAARLQRGSTQPINPSFNGP